MNKDSWYNKASVVTNVIIVIVSLSILLSQSFAINNNLSAVLILRDIVNHNMNYLLVLLYFIVIKFTVGKKHFHYLNIFLCFFFLLSTITSFLSVFQAVSLVSILSLFIKVLMCLFLLHSMFRDTHYWKDYFHKSPFNELNNDFYFYTIFAVCIILLAINLIKVTDVDGAFITILDCVYHILFARYVFLYHEYVDHNTKDAMFMEVDKLKKGLPKLNNVSEEVQRIKLNYYQQITIVIFIIGLVAGIFMGNLFPSCGSSSEYFSNVCDTTEFNLSLMVFIWFLDFLLCMLFYGIGTIISLLSSINDKLSKK